MPTRNTVVPLRIADEAFLVASTIERCPKGMMLRELVMNALEAAGTATDTPKLVRISARNLLGARKLCIWNTGRGLSAEELLKISDLSASLFKDVALDGNFGMGAKVASLSSNKFGLRYRSCRQGRVSQIILGQRNGIYGRIRQPTTDGGAAEVVDATAECLDEGDYGLVHDWTEVVLMGNAEGQDTVVAPYDNNPPVAADWLVQTLGRRFLRLPPGVRLRLDRAVTGAAVNLLFDPPFSETYFDRVERVPATDGIILHYCYRAADSGRARPPVNPAGLGAVIYNGEVYALVEGRRWALEAPTYGFTFASRLCSVLVELPAEFGVQPEVYRQFLRFRDGDQRQVMFGDFGALVRNHIPAWLKRIIDSMLPDSEDYLREIKADLQQLMLSLGVADLVPQQVVIRGVKPPAKPKDETASAEGAKAPEAKIPEAKPPAPRPPAPPRQILPTPPEIITISEEDELVERGLGGRAARYYPASRQMFVNTRYSAFARLAAELGTEFAAAADPEAIGHLAHQVAEWTLIRRLTRNVIYSMGKQRLGWSNDEVTAVQAAETLSLMVDDYELLLPAARQRMARLLGLEQPGGEQWGGGAEAGPGVNQAERLAAEMAEAEANLQRARTASATKLAPHYRRIADIESRRKNWGAAEAMLKQAIANDPEDPGPHYDLAGLRMSQGELDGAAEAAATAAALNTGTDTRFLRRRADIEQRRKNFATTEEMLHQAIALDPDDASPYYDLAGLRLAQGDLDAAATAAEAAVARGTGTTIAFLRRLSAVEARRGNLAAAHRLLGEAIILDPDDPSPHQDLAGLHLSQGDLDDASEAAEAAQARSPNSTGLLRFRAIVESRRKNWNAAEAVLKQAIANDPEDPGPHHDLAGLRLAQSDLDGAAEAAEAAMARSTGTNVQFLRRRADIEMRRKNFATAEGMLQQAIAAEPDNPGLHYDLAGLHMHQNDLDGALVAAEAALARDPGTTPVFLRRLSAVEARRQNFAVAGRLLAEAIARHPNDLGPRADLAAMRLSQGDVDGALEAAQAAIAQSPAPSASLLRWVGSLERRRGDLLAARRWLEQAIAADPAEPRGHADLSSLLVAMGDLDAAREAAEQALQRSGGTPTAPLQQPVEAAE
ncbi:Flp pilus assembly protein TadD [Humitalea rosea]|uniref:Flp pilus assembly protein TadD n=1 Tax=Humitalea rosea TaxID=990373 RepID=A0A2W7HVA1_9PROT|nr:tetratricopeptide repeat protein [Humitalea rosea]PZW36901.1 Flp pilus assembly protein TadD [Humitalea rosea]